jgi:hypothetical protein
MSDITTDFIKATNKIYAKVAAILTNLQVIENDVKLIREQAVSNANAPYSDAHASDSENQPELRLRKSSDTVKGSQPKGDSNNSNGEHNSGFRGFKKRWRKSIRKPVIQLEIAAIIGLVIYTCETRRTNNLTEQSLDLTRNSMEAQIVFGNWDFIQPLTSTSKLGIRIPMTNVGHMQAMYRVQATVYRWSAMPDSGFPLDTPEPDEIMDPNVPSPASILDKDPVSDEFIYGIPQFPEDATRDKASKQWGPPFTRPTIFVVGRLVYDSLGMRTDKQFCTFIVHANKEFPNLVTSTTDPRFAFMQCPKWHTTVRKPTK